MALGWRVIITIYESESARRAGANWPVGEFAPHLDCAGWTRERATSFRARAGLARDSLPVDVRQSDQASYESESAQGK